ncbi:hypothetical protein TNCV_1454911 [Trichonephila clavipes]|nr:hypothetical protein TNCV_1454911 [Trichonephila clavipes]
MRETAKAYNIESTRISEKYLKFEAMKRDSTNTRRAERKARAGMANNAAERQPSTGRKRTTGPQREQKGKTGYYQGRRYNISSWIIGVPASRRETLTPFLREERLTFWCAFLKSFILCNQFFTKESGIY